MRTRACTVAGLVVLALAGAACGSGPAGPTGPAGSDDAGSDDAVPRALAALAAEHLDVPPVAAAPLGRDQGVVPPSVGVELAAPWTDGDNAHLVVEVLAGRAGERQWRQARCAPRQERCEESSEGGGGGLLVQWDPLAYESDPGYVTVLARRADRSVVGIGFYGPPIPRRRPDDLVVTTLDELVALATDPDVSTTPPASAVADGAGLGDDVWLEWYGQGNGAPSPSS